MNPFVAVLASAFAVGAMAETQYQPNNQFQQFHDKQGLGASANLGFGDFGGVEASGNLNLPQSSSSLLTFAVIGLGVLSLINTISTIAIPFLKPMAKPETPAEPPAAGEEGGEDEGKKNNKKADKPGKGGRGFNDPEAFQTIADNVMKGIKMFQEKY